MQVFFDSLVGLFNTIVIGILSYILLVVFLRLSGKRTLSKLNAFDLVVTVALGSTLATVLLSRDVPLLEGALGLGLLISMQFVVTWLSVRVKWLRRAVRSDPTLLLYRGQLQVEVMDRERVTEGEVLAAVRGAGVAQLESVEAVVLETDGSLSVVTKPSSGLATSLKDLDDPRV